MPRGCNFSIVSAGAEFVKPAATGLKPAWGKKYLRDREHLRGLPVSKRIERVGHLLWKPVSVSRALEDSIGFPAALFQPQEREAANGSRVLVRRRFGGRQICFCCGKVGGF
jgi:hypothetical protein